MLIKILVYYFLITLDGTSFSSKVGAVFHYASQPPFQVNLVLISEQKLALERDVPTYTTVL